MQGNPLEPTHFLSVIHRRGVKYLLVGRQALIAYGSPAYTFDTDIFVDNSEGNIRLLLSIAEEFELYPSIPVEEILKTFKFKLENDVSIDVLCFKKISTGRGRVVSFQEMYERKTTLKGNSGLEIYVPCVADLVALKELRNSPKDREDIKYLKTIKKNYST